MSGIRVFSDGGYRMHLGKGAWAFIVVKDDEVICKQSGLVFDSTNNRCEYTAILRAIEWIGVSELDVHNCDVELVSDSQLVIKQITGEWKVNDMELLRLKSRIMVEGRKVFGDCVVKFTWNSRESEWTRVCDKMCDVIIESS